MGTLHPKGNLSDQARSRGGETLRRSRLAFYPDLLEPDDSQVGLGLVAKKSRLHASVSNHRLNILLCVSWRERPILPEGAGLGRRRKSGGGQRPHFFLGAAFLGAAFFGAGAAFAAAAFFGAALAICITSLFKDILA
jgi:hypothetical protein